MKAVKLYDNYPIAEIALNLLQLAEAYVIGLEELWNKNRSLKECCDKVLRQKSLEVRKRMIRSMDAFNSLNEAPLLFDLLPGFSYEGVENLLATLKGQTTPELSLRTMLPWVQSLTDKALERFKSSQEEFLVFLQHYKLVDVDYSTCQQILQCSETHINYKRPHSSSVPVVEALIKRLPWRHLISIVFSNESKSPWFFRFWSSLIKQDNFVLDGYKIRRFFFHASRLLEFFCKNKVDGNAYGEENLALMLEAVRSMPTSLVKAVVIDKLDIYGFALLDTKHVQDLSLKNALFADNNQKPVSIRRWLELCLADFALHGLREPRSEFDISLQTSLATRLYSLVKINLARLPDKQLQYLYTLGQACGFSNFFSFEKHKIDLWKDIQKAYRELDISFDMSEQSILSLYIFFRTYDGGLKKRQQFETILNFLGIPIPPSPTESDSSARFAFSDSPQAYKILGLEPGCSVEDIKKAYRKKALAQHPDKGGSKENFQELVGAYESLKKTRNFE